MKDTVVIDGDLDLISNIDGEIDLTDSESGEFGAFTALSERYPEYIGQTEITPSEQAQVLDTEMTSVMNNIVINPIPTNYGRLDWNGSVLRVY